MIAPRVYVDQELTEGTTTTVGAGPYRHLVVVLRRGPGDVVVLFNGRGGEYAAAIDAIGKRSLTVRVRERRDVERESPLAVTLAQAVSKGDRMDYAIQKAVELGVTAIQPLLTDRVVVRLDAARWQRKREQWQDHAIAACEQSGRTRIPRVAPVADLHAWLANLPGDARRFVLAPGAGAPAARLDPAGRPVILLVGPEGGLSDAELQRTGDAGFVSLTLGPRTLRTETAGVVGLAVLQTFWGDLGSALAQGR